MTMDRSNDILLTGADPGSQQDDTMNDDERIEVTEIRADIEETRFEMGGTLNELGDRLEPSHLVDQAKESVREATIGRVEETAKGVSDVVLDTIKRNPIPAALAGAGLALLWTNRSQGSQSGPSSEAYRYGRDGYPTYAHGNGGGSSVGSKIGDATSSAGQNVGGAVGSVAEGAQHVGGEVIDRAGETAQQVGWKLDSFMQASPLAMGAIAIGAGAVIGSLVPETSQERNMLGDASRQVTSAMKDTVDQATTTAEETMDKAEDKVASPA